jgi:endogenous inhibitor of DNA gyrase (YacG/DUF329 family)
MANCIHCGRYVPMGRRSYCTDRCLHDADLQRRRERNDLTTQRRRGRNGLSASIVKCKVCGNDFDYRVNGLRRYCSVGCQVEGTARINHTLYLKRKAAGVRA